MPDLDLSFFLDPPDLDTTAMLEIEALSPFSISTVRPRAQIDKVVSWHEKSPRWNPRARDLKGAIKEKSQDL